MSVNGELGEVRLIAYEGSECDGNEKVVSLMVVEGEEVEVGCVSGKQGTGKGGRSFRYEIVYQG